MKKRNDFVTNSSSSSFIISKNDDIDNVEKLFQFIKEMYCRWIDARESLIEYCKNNKDFIVEIDENGRLKISTIYSYKTEKERNKNREINDFLNKKFGIDIYSYYEFYTGWMEYDTYKEYLENTKNEKYVSYNLKPFLIYDFSNIDSDNSDFLEVLQWYYPCYNEDEVDEEYMCGYCKNNNTENCKNLKENNKYIPNELRSLCLFSECGYIPDFVRNELEKHCTLFCNHMG